MGNQTVKPFLPTKRFSFDGSFDDDYDVIDRYICVPTPKNTTFGSNVLLRAPDHRSICTKQEFLRRNLTLEPRSKLLVRHSLGPGVILAPRQSFMSKMETLKTQNYYFGHITRLEAEMMVISPKNHTGTFLVRQSERISRHFVITLKDYDLTRGYHIKHYRIRFNPRTGKYCVLPDHQFETIPEMIEYYQKRVTRLHLTQPVSGETSIVKPDAFIEKIYEEKINKTFEKWTVELQSSTEVALVEQALKIFRGKYGTSSVDVVERKDFRISTQF